MFTVTLVFALAASTSVWAKEGPKTYPGFSVFDKNGEYLRFVGPLYFKSSVYWSKPPPITVSDQLNVTFDCMPTIEAVSLFFNGSILFENMPVYMVDGSEDRCLISWMRCPYVKGKTYSQSYVLNLKDLGLMPGWYKGCVDMFTLIEGNKRIRMGRLELKVKFLEAS